MGTRDLLGKLAGRDSDSIESSYHPPPECAFAVIFCPLNILSISAQPNLTYPHICMQARAIMLLIANCSERQHNSADDIASLDAQSATTSETFSLGTRVDTPVNSTTHFPFTRSSATIKQSFYSTFASSPSTPVQVSQAKRPPVELMSKRTQAQLSFARKSSLARFLEKRKERVPAQEQTSTDEEIKVPETKRLRT
ncbi:hypothetical protein KP509_07G034500 [Ceratopteris richardii]|uniref:Uncharacterized protein n=1 Tax=Ceratopteris richardii TaxID=49495 RepID=A0A8T2UH70_CERRI|nr:hypothetical protein KP509_07G034500 [Ceratopteris richardii]